MSGNLYKKDHTPTTPGYAHGFNPPGLRNVGSYQVSGIPWITGSGGADFGLAQNKVHLIELPRVCKSFTVINNNTTADYDIRVHFQSGSGVSAFAAGATGHVGAKTIADTDDVIRGFHYITVPSGYASVTFDVKCKQFFISQNSQNANLTYQVIAELTNIPTSSMYHLTGSGITEAAEGDA
tara:strand:- start:785 stop:1327 length:543 start_codon:yes stop_codon:yes gene_type:complete